MRRLLLGLGLLFAALSPAGCRELAAPFTPPEAGGPSWVEITSPHFGLTSDLDPADARAAAVELERVYTSLQDVGFPYVARPRDRVRVILFRNSAEYLRVGPAGTGGFFNSGVWLGGEGPEPAAMFYGDLTAQMKATLRHELTHRFVRFYYPKTPAWLNEGLAHYYETVALEDGKVIVGRQPEVSKHRRTSDLVPTVDALLQMERGDFVPAPEDPDSRQNVRARRAAAWAFVHLLKSGGEAYRKAGEALLARLGKGADFAVAWEEARSLLDPAKLEADLAGSLHGGREFFILKTDYTPPAAEIESERTMSPTEVHLLWAALKRDPAEVEAALRLTPDSPAALRTRAHLLEITGSLAAAQEVLERARALSPEDPRVLFDLFRLYTHGALQKGAPPGFRERAEALVPRLLPVASSASSLRLLAANLAFWGRADEAMPLALRAIETDRSCWRCYDTLAEMLARRGEVADAVKAQSLALDLMPEAIEETTRRPAHDRLLEYRAATNALLSDAVIRTILKRRVDGYQRCYTDGLARDPKLGGQVVAHFVIQRDGSPAGVADGGSTLPDKEVVACVLAEIGQLRFPRREAGAPQAVTHPLVFAPPGDAGRIAPSP